MKKQILAIASSLALGSIPLCAAWSPVNSNAPQAQAEAGYCASARSVENYGTEYLMYFAKTPRQDWGTEYEPPKYGQSSTDNICGPVAGATAVGYYDRYYGNMISNWNSYYTNSDYKDQDSVYVPALINDLYSKMKTTSSGTSESNCKSGLVSYCSSKGYTVTYKSIYSNGVFDLNSFKTAVTDKNQIAIIFVEPSSLYTLTPRYKYDEIRIDNYTARHVMIAYGYYHVAYAYSDGRTRYDHYLKVASGYSETGNCYYKLDDGSMYSAYIIQVN